MRASKVIAIGVMPQGKLRERVLAIARGDYRPQARDPKIWFTSMKVAADVFSDENRALLRTIAETQPASITALAAETGKKARHLFRHTMATLMLENGADIRFIQAMLGHVSLNTTQIYTQVSIRQLKAIHTATHPGRLPVARAAAEVPAADRDTLLATLDAEAAEEAAD